MNEPIAHTGVRALALIMNEIATEMDDRDVGAGRRAITILPLHFKGRAVLLKSIPIASLSRATDFRRALDDLTLEQGLARLFSEGQTRSQV